MQLSLNNLKIGISSLGLIGGSLFKALQANGVKQLVIHSSNKDTIDKITTAGFSASDDAEILSDCDIIFICAPISKTIDAIKKIYIINPNALILDVASIKENILNEAEKMGCKFIGSHPMAGTENSGFNSSFAELFEGATWVLTPSKNVQDDDIAIAKSIIEITGANTIVCDAKEHDKAVANISHLPMLLAQSLIKTNIDNELSLNLASSGYRDTTRLAMSNEVMAKDMLLLNKKNIEIALNDLINEAQKLLDDENYFSQNIQQIIQVRKNLYNCEGKNSFRK